MRKKPALTKIFICVLMAVVVVSASAGVQKTGAWFVDSGTWVDATYGVGVIDYTVSVNDEDIGKVKGGQKVSVTIPVTGGAKLADQDRTVPAVSRQLPDGVQTCAAHDEFDEGVTLVRMKLVNSGGLPMAVRATVTAPKLADNGMLYLVLPEDVTPDPDNYSLIMADNSRKTYRQYIREKMADGYGSYAAIVSSLSAYHGQTVNGIANNTVVYPGKLPTVKDQPPENLPHFDVNVLCWAEYDQMPWSAEGARDNTKAVEQKFGVMSFLIDCTL